MKKYKLFLYLVLVLICENSGAQILKNSMLVQGTLGGQYESHNQESEFDFYLLPSFEYFILKNTSVSVISGINYNRNKFPSSEESFFIIKHGIQFSIGTDISCYFTINNLHPFILIGGGYARGTLKYKYDVSGPDRDSKYWTNSFFIQSGIGLLYLLNSSVGLKTQVTYKFKKDVSSGDSSSAQEVVSKDDYIVYSLGFIFFIGKTKPEIKN